MYNRQKQELKAQGLENREQEYQEKESQLQIVQEQRVQGQVNKEQRIQGLECQGLECQGLDNQGQENMGQVRQKQVRQNLECQGKDMQEQESQEQESQEQESNRQESNRQESNRQESNRQEGNRQESSKHESSEQESQRLEGRGHGHSRQPGYKNDKNKRMPVWALILMDLSLTVVGLGAFSFYQLLVPRAIQHDTTVLAAPEISGNTFLLPDTTKTEVTHKEDKSKPAIHQAAPPKTEAIRGNYGNTGTMDIASDTSNQSILTKDRIITEVNSYKDSDVEFATRRVEVGSGSDKITYYVTDVFVTNVQYIKTAFAKGKFGKNYRDRTAAMAKENKALLAISGDYYGNGETGIVIRNGVLYRSEGNDADICVLFTDGTMNTYSPEEFDAEDILKKGAWQAWTFGPQLLDGEGNILASFNTTVFLNSINPRCAIGYVEPGHYVFLVVDGRNEGYSRGVSLSELAQLMRDAGCRTAYNLDGGKSAGMVYDGEYVNQPCEGGRAISDIIYIGE